MKRDEQLKFCKVCKNQKFDMKNGIICGLTYQTADFEEQCHSFIEDSELKQQYESNLAANSIQNNTASQGKRLANYFIDLICVLGFSFVFGVLLAIVCIFLFPSSLYLIEEDNKPLEYFLGFTAGMIYYTVLEATTGKTIAKFITKTKVVTEEGEKPDFMTILIRSLCRYIPFAPFSFLGSENSGWHDRFSKTRVINI